MELGVCALLLWLLSGCQPYALRGRVIEGPRSAVVVVSPDDPRLTRSGGLGGARIALELDPRSLGRKPLGGGISEENGQFQIPVGEFGAGVLEYELGVLARRAGYAPAEENLKLPGGDKRLLIILGRGIDRVTRPDDPLDDLRRFGTP